MTGPITEPGTGRGAYGGDNPAFLRRSLGAFWSALLPRRADSFSVTSGAIFRGAETPATHLAYPLKSRGALLTDGYDASRHRASRLMLTLRDGSADIVPLTPETLAAATAPALLGGLAPSVDLFPRQRVGRTLVGVRDADNDGVSEVLLVYSSAAATQDEAVAALQAFGARRIMVLGGGSATQMIARGVSYVASGATIPQAIGVRGAARPPQGTYRATHTIKRAGSCTIQGGDIYTHEEDVDLVRLGDGFSFAPSGNSLIRGTYAHADRANALVNKTVICGSVPEQHTARARALFEEGAIRIPAHRITWCESMNCVFDESWSIRTGTSQGLQPASSGPGEQAPADGSCVGADCSPR